MKPTWLRPHLLGEPSPQLLREALLVTLFPTTPLPSALLDCPLSIAVLPADLLVSAALPALSVPGGLGILSVQLPKLSSHTSDSAWNVPGVNKYLVNK